MAKGQEEAGEPALPQGTPDEYSWLQAQLQAANLNTTLHVQEVVEGDDGGDDWADPDPSNGILTQLLDALEYGSEEEALPYLAQLDAGLVNVVGPDGDTALHLASLYGKLECVQKLLALGAKATIPNPQDQTLPVHDACAGGFLEIAQLLLDSAPETVNIVDADGEIPLHCAARGDHADVVKLLLSKGADISLKNMTGNTPDMEAEDEQVKKLILDAASS